MYRFLTLCAALAMPFGAAATSNVSPRFDGSYSGTATPVPAMSTGSCEAFRIPQVVINRGIIRSPKTPDGPVLSGLVTDEGYVQVRMAQGGRQPQPMDGRIEDKIISAGFIDNALGCAWLVELTRE